MTLSQTWAIIATIFIIITPVLNEIWDIYHAFRYRKRVGNEPEIRTRVEKSDQEPDTILETINFSGIKGNSKDTRMKPSIPGTVTNVTETQSSQDLHGSASVF